MFQEPGQETYGPTKWQKDIVADQLRSNWERVLDVLRAAQDNPKADKLYDELLVTARRSLGIAKADWADIRVESDVANSHYGEGFDDVFAQVEKKIDAINGEYL